MKTSLIATAACFLIVAGSNLSLSAAGLPVGNLQVQISDPTNHVWDATRIGELQSPEVRISDSEVFVAFSAPFTQNGAGKLTGAGATEMTVHSPIFDGAVQGAYVANGSITAAKGIAKLTLISAAKGPAMIEGKAQTLLATAGVKITLNSLTESASGVYLVTALATGHGAVKESGPLTFPWPDAITAMGSGAWTLSLALTNDAVKKVGGTATVNLSTGHSLGFTAKGTYNAKNGSTLLVLAGDTPSKGSSLKVTLTSTNTAVLKGKLSGQTVNAFGALAPNLPAP